MLKNVTPQMCVSMLVVLGLTGCDFKTHIEFPKKEETKNTFDMSQDENEPVEGRKLIDIAGQAIAPESNDIDHASILVSEDARRYVGRYKVKVSCTDPIVYCEKGTADFILNLLEDGTAHRTITYLGTITYASAQQYRQDTWTLDEDNHQIVLHRASGVEFFYDIDKNKNLVMNLERIANASPTNIAFFQEGNPFPHAAYVLKPETQK